jgi:hypothetical protein
MVPYTLFLSQSAVCSFISDNAKKELLIASGVNVMHRFSNE